MGTKPGKKTKKQLMAEKRLARLKKAEKELSRTSATLNKKLDRERKAGQREIDSLEKQISKLEDKRDAVYDRALPSQKKFDKVENQLLGVRNTLREMSTPEPVPESSRRPDREAGDEGE